MDIKVKQNFTIPEAFKTLKIKWQLLKEKTLLWYTTPVGNHFIIIKPYFLWIQGKTAASLSEINNVLMQAQAKQSRIEKQ